MHVPIAELEPRISVHTHHTESVDPTLAGWINDLLHDLLGWGPWSFVIVLGIAIVLIPLWLIYNAVKQPADEDDANRD